MCSKNQRRVDRQTWLGEPAVEAQPQGETNARTGRANQFSLGARRSGPRRLQFTALALALTYSAASCSDDVFTAPEPSRSVVEPISRRIDRPPEQPFVEIATTVPSFAGFFVEDGKLVGLVKDPSDASAAMAALNAFRAADSDLASLQAETRPADYSFRELAGWRDLAFDHAFVAFDEVVTLDLDERRNRVAIGLESDAVRERVLDALLALGVPAGAVILERGARVMPLADTTLQQHQRPVRGGMKIFSEYGADCTFGFSAKLGTTNVFFTASHCSHDFWYTDGTNMSQPVLASGDNLISLVEYNDPDFFDCSNWWPFKPERCRYSDASAFVPYTGSGATFDFGYIARVEGPPGDSVTAGSIVIDESNPRYWITSSGDAIGGQTVNKIGKSTGWTEGDVTDTCKDVISYNQRFGEPHQFIKLCQHLAEHRADKGDSGAPVFTITGSSIELNGILSSRDTVNNLIIYSPISGIEHEKDFDTDVLVVAVYPVTASIDGPSQVQPQVECTWEADVSGGTLPYSYQWSGVLSGTGSSVSGEVSSSGNLSLTVTDVNDLSDGDLLYITVSGGAPDCEA